MRFIHPFLATLLIGTALSGAAAQPQIGPSAIVVNPVPSFTAEVSVDRDASGAGTPVYNVGDPVTVTVRSSEAGYVYLFNVRSSGEVVQLLPNRLDAAGGDNAIAAGATKTFPPPGARSKPSMSNRPPGTGRCRDIRWQSRPSPAAPTPRIRAS